MTKIEKAELEAKGIKVTICKPRKARGFESFSNFKSNSKRMKGYKKFDEPQGYKISSIYNCGRENENDYNKENASSGGNATCGEARIIGSFNKYRSR